MTDRALDLLYATLHHLVLGTPDNVAELEDAWRENRDQFNRMKAARPAQWQALVDLATRRKAALLAGGHLTPESGSRQHGAAFFRLSTLDQAAYLRGERDLG